MDLCAFDEIPASKANTIYQLSYNNTRLRRRGSGKKGCSDQFLRSLVEDEERKEEKGNCDKLLKEFCIEHFCPIRKKLRRRKESVPIYEQFKNMCNNRYLPKCVQ